jgi:hypothetical protein
MKSVTKNVSLSTETSTTTKKIISREYATSISNMGFNRSVGSIKKNLIICATQFARPPSHKLSFSPFCNDLFYFQFVHTNSIASQILQNICMVKVCTILPFSSSPLNLITKSSNFYGPKEEVIDILFYIENVNISVVCKFRNSEIEKIISEVFAFLSLWPKINNAWLNLSTIESKLYWKLNIVLKAHYDVCVSVLSLLGQLLIPSIGDDDTNQAMFVFFFSDMLRLEL